MPFNGLRVLALESRRSGEIAALIRKQGGDPFVAPAMRETPLDRQEDAFEFAQRLLRGDFECVILLTGVGARLLWKILLTRHGEEALREALRRVTLVARGPKPAAALREFGLAHNVLVPEPNTWRELLAIMAPRAERMVAVQEYGKSHAALIDGLRAQGRTVMSIRVYGWELPEDTGPLREAVRRLAAGRVDIVLLTTSMQIVNLMRIAEEEGIGGAVRDSLKRSFVGSIGPSTTETLEEYGIRPGFEPSHPKMGLLVNEAAARF